MRVRQKARLVLLLAAVSAIGAAAALAADPLTVTFKDPPPDPSNSSTATFDFSADPPGNVTFACTLDGQDVPCDPPPYKTPTLKDGEHTFTVTATSSGDRTGSASHKWTIDTKPPTVSITKKPGDPSNEKAPAVEFTSDDDTATFECRLDESEKAACTSPFTTAELTEGQHKFHVEAKDKAGNTASADYAWTVDLTPPVVTFAEQPSATTTDSVARFAFTVDDADAALACALDGAPPAACGSPYTSPQLGIGAHTFAVEATDKAGNAARATYSWTVQPLVLAAVDTTPPDTADPLDYFVTYRYAELTWTRPDDADFDHVALFLVLGGSREQVYSGTATSYEDRAFNNGVDHRYAVVSYDRAGNASPAATLVISSSALIPSPRRGAVVRRAPTLRWAPIPRARFYNVQLFRNGRKVMSTWPRRPRVRLATHWRYRKHAYRLGRGTYDWYVWPSFGNRYGPPIGHSAFVVR